MKKTAWKNSCVTW